MFYQHVEVCLSLLKIYIFWHILGWRVTQYCFKLKAKGFVIFTYPSFHCCCKNLLWVKPPPPQCLYFHFQIVNCSPFLKICFIPSSIEPLHGVYIEWTRIAAYRFAMLVLSSRIGWKFLTQMNNWTGMWIQNTLFQIKKVKSVIY